MAQFISWVVLLPALSLTAALRLGQVAASEPPHRQNDSPERARAPRAAAAPGTAGPAPVVDNGEFMDLFLKSSYSELQQAMAKPPSDRKEWAAIYQKAIRLAEMQNLLFFRDRDEVQDPRWATLTAGSRQAAADLAAAALFGLRNVRKADYDEVRRKYAAVADACNACHRVFARDAPTIKP